MRTEADSEARELCRQGGPMYQKYIKVLELLDYVQRFKNVKTPIYFVCEPDRLYGVDRTTRV